MIFFIEVSVPGHLNPTKFGFQTRWSAEAFDWNMTSILRREFRAHIAKVNIISTDLALEFFHRDNYKILSSVDEAIRFCLAAAQAEHGEDRYSRKQTFIFTYRIRGSGYSQDDALENALEAFNEYPREPDNVEIE